PGSVLVVSHDRYFLDRVATSLLVFEGGGAVRHYIGDYGSYSRLRRERAELARASAREVSEASTTSATNAAAAATPKRPPKLSYKEERELAEIEKTIEAAEREVGRIEADLADPDVFRSDPTRAGRLGTELGDAQARVAALMDRWQELESKREAFEASR
ncbi:MAG TPA: ABC transporter ATP-binding protein, partial [Polyangiaceae bacterium]|nr:ABC transporter ATP-binding protein [Polyangiaceae bacterium]